MSLMAFILFAPPTSSSIFNKKHSACQSVGMSCEGLADGVDHTRVGELFYKRAQTMANSHKRVRFLLYWVVKMERPRVCQRHWDTVSETREILGIEIF